ncbi:MAG: response regulator [Nitrospirae bacterium]|nr:response regulator [Nitrospirota bacterium]
MECRGILIVDDEIAPRESIRAVLKDKYTVATASGVEEALKYLAENPVDVVMLDLKMPKIDGITALLEIKKRYPKTEIILLTAYATLAIIKKVLELGAFGCLIKPFDKDELLDIVDRALKK